MSALRLRVLFVCVWFVIPNTWGWSPLGHGQIASQLDEKLTVKKQETFRRLAKTLWDNYASEAALRDMGAACEAQRESCFLGYWPDTIKREPLSDIYRQAGLAAPKKLTKVSADGTADWHYHNEFYSPEQKGFVTGCKNKGKLLRVIPMLVAQFETSEVPLERAILLSFIVHLVADAHQPLHMFTATVNGCYHDLGGNRYCLEQTCGGCELNLHAFWDDGAGIFKQAGPLARLTAEAEESPLGSLLETMKVEAKEYAPIVYSDDVREDFTRYSETVADISRQRASLATVRLALLLNRLL